MNLAATFLDHLRIPSSKQPQRNLLLIPQPIMPSHHFLHSRLMPVLLKMHVRHQIHQELLPLVMDK